jgi:hypothetical protein
VIVLQVRFAVGFLPFLLEAVGVSAPQDTHFATDVGRNQLFVGRCIIYCPSAEARWSDPVAGAGTLNLPVTSLMVRVASTYCELVDTPEG